MTRSAQTLLLRPARPADVPALLALVQALTQHEGRPEAFTADAPDYSAHFFGPRRAAEALVAELDGRVRGCAVFQMRFSTFRGRPMLNLEDLVVEAAMRGRGIGRALLAALARTAVDRGAVCMEWSALAQNSRALRLYQSIGARTLEQNQSFRLGGAALAELAGLQSGGRPGKERRTRMAMTCEQLVQAAKAEIEEMTVEQARAALPGLKLVDVREPAEFQAGALPGAVNLPRGLLEFKLAQVPALSDPNAPVLLYCASGGRSALAAQSLKRLGYSQVASLAGGIQAWQAAGGSADTPA